jgi:hypothetical protein
MMGAVLTGEISVSRQAQEGPRKSREVPNGPERFRKSQYHPNKRWGEVHTSPCGFLRNMFKILRIFPRDYIV